MYEQLLNQLPGLVSTGADIYRIASGQESRDNAREAEIQRRRIAAATAAQEAAARTRITTTKERERTKRAQAESQASTWKVWAVAGTALLVLPTTAMIYSLRFRK